MLHLSLFKFGKTPQRPFKERPEIRMDRRLPTGIWRTKEMIYGGTSPTNAGPFKTLPNWNGRLKYATGAVLTQLDSNGDRHPVSFISGAFSPAERNYEIYDRELLAIIRALNEWRHYIQGSPHTTTILSDHKNLTYYREARKLNRPQVRWSLYLSEFDVKLIHTPGHKMIQSDTLCGRSLTTPFGCGTHYYDSRTPRLDNR